jgi:hypothetical protein
VNQWVTLSAASANGAPLSSFIMTNSYSDATGSDGISFASNAYVLYLPYSHLSAFMAAYGSTPIQMRSIVTDVTGRIASDEYTLTFLYSCWTDSLTIALANNIGDQTYQFGASLQSLQLPVITQTQTGCPVSYEVFGYFSN